MEKADQCLSGRIDLDYISLALGPATPITMVHGRNIVNIVSISMNYTTHNSAITGVLCLLV